VAIDNFSIAASAILAADDFNRHHFKLYPNPSSSVFYIQRPGIDEMRVSVYDVTGRLVYEKDKINSAHFTLDLAGVEQGLYFLKVIEGNKQLSTTILKQ